MSKVWEVKAVFNVVADTEEDVWVKWASDRDVTYDCIDEITELWEEDDDE